MRMGSTACSEVRWHAATEEEGIGKLQETDDDREAHPRAEGQGKARAEAGEEGGRAHRKSGRRDGRNGRDERDERDGRDGRGAPGAGRVARPMPMYELVLWFQGNEDVRITDQP